MAEEKEDTHIILFKGKAVRRKLVENKWFFSVVDVVGALTDSEDPRNYLKVLKHRLNEEGSEVVTFCNQLKLASGDGKEYETDCADTEGIFRIIQSIPNYSFSHSYSSFFPLNCFPISSAHCLRTSSSKSPETIIVSLLSLKGNCSHKERILLG